MIKTVSQLITELKKYDKKLNLQVKDNKLVIDNDTIIDIAYKNPDETFFRDYCKKNNINPKFLNIKKICKNKDNIEIFREHEKNHDTLSNERMWRIVGKEIGFYYPCSYMVTRIPKLDILYKILLDYYSLKPKEDYTEEFMNDIKKEYLELYDKARNMK